jgi:predicted Zn finger-like uncharacterized protein
MRLVCPNCEAKYEVPEDAIPETGRDVQCANCGHAWFQMRRATGAETATAAPVAAPAAPEPAPVVEPAPVAEAVVEPPPVQAEIVPETTEPEPEPEPEPEAAPELVETVAEAAAVEPALEAAKPEPAPEPVAPVAEDVTEAPADPVADEVAPTPAVAAEVAQDIAPEAPAAEPAATGAAAYAVDESVLAILREEAERETKARQAEATRPLETQTDLGIEQAIMPVASKVPDVVAEDPALVARRARLPDVEEINSTLRPSEMAAEAGGPDAAPVAAESRSFRSGFLLVLTVAILGSAIYGSADAIAETVPALAGPLKSYVAFIDSLRLQLDGLMQSATVAINGN